MSDAELEKLRGQLYLLAQTVLKSGEDRFCRSIRHNSTLDTDDGQAYDHGGLE